jgi:hypothetical protein
VSNVEAFDVSLKAAFAAGGFRRSNQSGWGDFRFFGNISRFGGFALPKPVPSTIDRDGGVVGWSRVHDPPVVSITELSAEIRLGSSIGI